MNFASDQLDTSKPCPYCSEIILSSAQKCKHCGEYLDPKLRAERKKEIESLKPPLWSPGVAAVMSLIIPGLGQMYKGQIINGLFWLVVVLVGYMILIVPGLILHLFCILGAASGDSKKREGF